MMKETGITAKVVLTTAAGPPWLPSWAATSIVSGAFTANLLLISKQGSFAPWSYWMRSGTLCSPMSLRRESWESIVVFLMWRGVLAPKATPRPVIDKLAAAFKKMTEDKSVVSMIQQFW